MTPRGAKLSGEFMCSPPPSPQPMKEQQQPPTQSACVRMDSAEEGREEAERELLLAGFTSVDKPPPEVFPLHATNTANQPVSQPASQTAGLVESPAEPAFLDLRPWPNRARRSEINHAPTGGASHLGAPRCHYRLARRQRAAAATNCARVKPNQASSRLLGRSRLIDEWSRPSVSERMPHLVSFLSLCGPSRCSHRAESEWRCSFAGQ